MILVADDFDGSAMRLAVNEFDAGNWVRKWISQTWIQIR